MKKQWKGFLTGFLTAALLLCLGSPAFAATVRQLNATFNDIKITIDGTEFVPKDFNGNKLEPFTVDGATYLPVRAVAEALGLTVEWDQAAQTVKLTRPGSQNASNTGTVIMDQNGVRITFLGFAPNDSWMSGYDIKLRIENNSSKNYTVQVRDLSVNGIMADRIFSCEVAAGKTANDAIQIYNMEERGITAPVTTAELTFHIFGTDDWEDSFDSSVITLR